MNPVYGRLTLIQGQTGCAIKLPTPLDSVRDGRMQLIRFRHKGLKQLHEDSNAKGIRPAILT